jgi:hypothetical protein
MDINRWANSHLLVDRQALQAINNNTIQTFHWWVQVEMCNNSSSRLPTRRTLIHPLLSSSLLVTESTTKIPQELRVSVFEFLEDSSNIFNFFIEFNMQRSSPKG